MSSFQTEERGQVRRQWVDQAIALAMQNRWADAAKMNQSILESYPEDTDTLNRLGRALTELGRYKEARESYQKSVQHDPSNTIARKNLARLSSLKVEEAPASGEKVDPRMFISETGKTGVFTLQHPAPKDVLAKFATGDQVILRADGRILRVESMQGSPLGQVDPKVGQRLIDLLRTGNTYTAAVMSNDDGLVKIFVRETSQSPNNASKVSFPVRSEGQGIRPYTRETLLKYELEEEDDVDSDDTEFGDHDDESDEPLEVSEIEDDRSGE
jgi:tetratricopeptide (TPR) repeat protein